MIIIIIIIIIIILLYRREKSQRVKMCEVPLNHLFVQLKNKSDQLNWSTLMNAGQHFLYVQGQMNTLRPLLRAPHTLTAPTNQTVSLHLNTASGLPCDRIVEGISSHGETSQLLKLDLGPQDWGPPEGPSLLQFYLCCLGGYHRTHLLSNYHKVNDREPGAFLPGAMWQVIFQFNSSNVLPVSHLWIWLTTWPMTEQCRSKPHPLPAAVCSAEKPDKQTRVHVPTQRESLCDFRLQFVMFLLLLGLCR